MALRIVQSGLAIALAATVATGAQARAAAPCSPSGTRADTRPAAACAAASGTAGHADIALSLILIGCAAGIGSQVSRRRGVKQVFS